jgi:curli biogenesis system outer membrane secretion channel CsgG
MNKAVHGMWAAVILFTAALTACTSVSPDIQAEKVPENSSTKNAVATYVGLKRKVAIARFSNETQYAKGAFYDKDNDPIGRQALDILSTKLEQSGKFILLERADIDKIAEEQKYSDSGTAQKIGADFLIIGSVTEYGRKNVGEADFLSHSKRQIVQAAVSLRLVDVSSGQVIYSEEGRGEAETESKTVLGIGGQAGYDATLDDKAISAAISKLVENIINNCMDKPWRSYFLSYDADAVIISGGKHIGIKTGDTFDVYERGRKVKNPSTGLFIELPGKKTGTVKVLSTGGDTSENEYSVVEMTSGTVNPAVLSNYEIREAAK